ncbi:hypothetical protein ACFYOA_08050 [Streptomyces iakyrus]|uniref:hypothetical protein n=1 Tax=Streptomyces iakyrus TaxID=68219 RepID=UPI0036B27811
MMKVTRETKAELKTKDGQRVIGFTKDSEPGVASLAVPADRAKLTPAELRELAAWANQTAQEIESTRPSITFRGDTYVHRPRSAQETNRRLADRALRNY